MSEAFVIQFDIPDVPTLYGAYDRDFTSRFKNARIYDSATEASDELRLYGAGFSVFGDVLPVGVIQP